MMKKDYFVRSCIYNRICVVGKKEAIYPLVQTVNALYLQLLEMQKAFIKCCEPSALNNLPNNVLPELIKTFRRFFRRFSNEKSDELFYSV